MTTEASPDFPRADPLASIPTLLFPCWLGLTLKGTAQCLLPRVRKRTQQQSDQERQHDLPSAGHCDGREGHRKGPTLPVNGVLSRVAPKRAERLPAIGLLTHNLRKTLSRWFTLMLFSCNTSVIKGINGGEKRPVWGFDFLILMAYLFTPASPPIGFSLHRLAL